MQPNRGSGFSFPTNSYQKLHHIMSKDLFSILNKSKSSISKVQSTKAKNVPLKLVDSVQKSSLLTHDFNIIDQYLIEVKPKAAIPFSNSSIVSFDLDGTLIRTKSNQKFAVSCTDWKWFNDKVIPKLKSINSPIVIFSNQGGVVADPKTKSYVKYKEKLELVLKDLEKNGVDVSKVWIYASPKQSAAYKKQNKFTEQFNKMRKPEMGMFEQFTRDFQGEIDLDKSVFIGDAAGRHGDFSDSDLKFANNVGLPFKTPEEYFK